MQSPLRQDEAREMAKHLLNVYYKTSLYPFTRHHIDSYDQFVSEGIPSILRARNPVLIVKDLLPNGTYKYKIEMWIGGEDGRGVYMGTPTISLQNTEEVRLLFPNEARLRNMTYAATLMVDVLIRVTIQLRNPQGVLQEQTTEIRLQQTEDRDERIPLCRLPILLHSRYCLLHKKPAAFLREAGESEYDYGGYYVIDGAEKVLITRQEQAFNTLYISHKPNDPKIKIRATISCLSPTTRLVKSVNFEIHRDNDAIYVSIPFVRAPIPLFVLFRAMGVQSDKDILNMIFPDPDSAEAKLLGPRLVSSISDALPFVDTYSSLQFMKVLTKGFSVEHVLDILHNQLFIHVEDLPNTRIAFLAECTRSLLRVSAGIDQPTNRDDTRNQRCLTSGFLTQQLFQGHYTTWLKKTMLAIDEEYAWKVNIYSDEKFVDIFLPGNRPRLFKEGLLTELLMRGFKGKWGSGVGEEKTGVLQALSRLSYHDFLSHCRRVVLDFDTGMKLPGPRRLNPSQYGYFCTSETPTGASIGITKNLSMMTQISTATQPAPFIQWLFSKGGLLSCNAVSEELRQRAVPVFVNGGIVGYSQRPDLLKDVLKAMKWTGCLPAYSSIGFSIRDRRVFVYLDDGRPLRPLIHLGPGGSIPAQKLMKLPTWRTLVLGTLEQTLRREIDTPGFFDPLADKPGANLEEYLSYLEPHVGCIEYVDPYEQNEIYVANYPDYIIRETSHLEIHPSTIVGLMTSMIPFPNHNQSPRNQLSCSQSKQGISVYSLNYPNRFDNQAHVLCYGEAPLTRTLYYDYVADGQIPYGQNLVLAIGSFTGYNQDDGIVMNADALARGMFRNMTFRSYQAFEENDEKGETETRIGNPQNIPAWKDLKPGLDYTKLDPDGLVRVGEYVDQYTVIAGRYIKSKAGQIRDASVTPQVWTRGRVEKIAITVNNLGLRLIKIRVVQDRVPELGDKFSNRHGQKGTIGMAIRGHDMPRTVEGIVPDMIMNPHAIPSRMTIAQLLETIFGKAAARLGAIANGTAFMNDGDPSEAIGEVLEKEFGLEKYGNEILYDGTTGVQIPSTIFIGHCFTMRLKHMTEDKLNVRGQGRREQRTHQPTGGRGNEGGLRIGEMERDAVAGHGISMFLSESMMKRGDGTQFTVCNGCGTIPIFNTKENLYICPTCDGPVQYAGDTVSSLEILPPNKRSLATFSTVDMPYVVKLLEQEMATYANLSMRFLTTKDVQKLKQPALMDIQDEQLAEFADSVLPQFVLPETKVPEMRQVQEEAVARPEDLAALGAIAVQQTPVQEEQTEDQQLEQQLEGEPLPAAAAAAAAAPVSKTSAVTTAPVSQVAPMMAAPVPVFTAAPMMFSAAAAAPTSNQAQATQVMMPTSVAQPVYYTPMLQTQTNQPAQLMTAPMMGAPPTLVVDTSPQAMEASGLPPNVGQNIAPQFRPTAQAGGLRKPGATRKANRVRFGGGEEGGMSQQAAPSPSSSLRVTVNKLG